MQTNFQMLKELLKVYQPQKRGFVNATEKKLIQETLHLADMDILALRNLRDFTVVYMSREDILEKHDKMSAIVYIIDLEILNRGGVV